MQEIGNDHGKKTGIRIRTWNIRDQEITMELQRCKIDICAINETKKKGTGITSYNEYILIYSRMGREQRKAWVT